MSISQFISKARAASALFAGALLLSATAFAQGNLTVTGTVREATGEPVIGAGVLVAGTPSGAVTDIDGTYRITGVKPDAVITVTAIGFKTIEEPVRGRNRIDFTLEGDFLALDDAVVIGYGTQRKGDITSAVASVKSEEFLAGNIGDAAQLIKGKVAGLNVTKGNGD
ncbi:MAG: carboxypeptidase-like regulatory domain-containing protein, partial [Bacteroidales bacterium]|nr:carboxypeptidase-like regulatory domain-containing protein [Bacteroidales bacterium]